MKALLKEAFIKGQNISIINGAKKREQIFKDWYESNDVQAKIKLLNLNDVSGSLPAVNTTKIIKEQYDFDGLIDMVECCKIGPITNENYCPNCGKKILRQ